MSLQQHRILEEWVRVRIPASESSSGCGIAFRSHAPCFLALQLPPCVVCQCPPPTHTYTRRTLPPWLALTSRQAEQCSGLTQLKECPPGVTAAGAIFRAQLTLVSRLSSPRRLTPWGSFRVCWKKNFGEDKRAENKLQGQRWTIVILLIITVVNIYRALTGCRALS